MYVCKCECEWGGGEVGGGDILPEKQEVIIEFNEQREGIYFPQLSISAAESSVGTTFCPFHET